MESNSYKQFWNRQAASAQAAAAAVDGSVSEDILRHTGRYAAAQVRAALDVKPGDRLLELGCGVGRIGKELAPHCGHWTGVDISENMVRYAGERLEEFDNVSLHQLTRSALEMIPDASIDKAYSIAVFCHMDKEDLYLYLQELHRVLAPGGMIFVETWNLAHPVGWRRWEYEPRAWAHMDQSRRKDVARNQFCTPDEFALYISGAGFEILGQFDDSQSIQVIAGKDMDKSRRRQEARRIKRDAKAIAYSPMYAELFGQFVDVIFGTRTAAQMLEYIDAQRGDPDAALYRPYLLELWRKNAELWGDPPA